MILNEYQMAAVLDEHPACIVNANVGSGKTTVLIEKIAWLQREKKIDLKDMVVLTFTNKAAGEIKNRLNQETDELYFGTFHSVAMRLLSTVLPVEEFHRTKNFQIMLPEEELEIARQLIIQYDLKIKYKNRLKKRMEDWAMKKTSSYEDDLEQLMHYLEQEKENQDKMTYRDLILFCKELLVKYPDLFRPKWLIIDEVQDCDKEQLELIDALKKEETRLFAVGDPNQVIYGWRGSAFQVFSQIRNRYDAVELTLPVNYRSSKVILQAAGRFKQSGEALIGMEDTGEKIHITGHYDPFAEADYLAGRIKELYTEGISYEEIGIFYRLQSQAEVLTKVLHRYGIPYEVSLRQQFFEIPVINWLYHLIRYLANEADQISLLRIITNSQYGDHLTEKKAIKLLQKEDTDSIPILKQITELFSQEWFHQEVTDSWIEHFIEGIDLPGRIGLTSSFAEEDMRHAQEFLELIRDSRKDLKAFVNEAALYGIAFHEEEAARKQNKVKLMTLHAAKGLEFSYVFLIGMNPGLMPLRGSGEEQEEEEQRLLFVGMTRARRYLELSYYTSAPSAAVLAGPSPYLRMIKSDLVASPLQEKKDQKQAAEHLQRLKREILRQRQEAAVPEKEEKEEEKRIRISHPRYGLGYIISEDEDKIVFDFDDFGEKEMLKILCNFTIISE